MTKFQAVGRRTFAAGLSAAALGAALVLGGQTPAAAQAKYPDRPVRLILPFGARRRR